MPEFIMDTCGEVEGIGKLNRSHIPSTLWEHLDEFTQGYIEAMFFTEHAPNVDREEFESADYQKRMEAGLTCGSIPGDSRFGDLDSAALSQIVEDCREFQESFAELLSRACEHGNYDMAKAGRDFWYTRNGHGLGFWDRGLGDIGDELSEMSRPYGEVYTYWHNGKIHLA